MGRWRVLAPERRWAGDVRLIVEEGLGRRLTEVEWRALVLGCAAEVGLPPVRRADAAELIGVKEWTLGKVERALSARLFDRAREIRTDRRRRQAEAREWLGRLPLPETGEEEAC